MMKRKRLTPGQKLVILARYDQRCAVCGQPFTKDNPADFDHKIALELGGPDTPENMRPLHRLTCHRDKTRLDVGQIAKGKRQRKKFGALRGMEVPEPKFKRPMASRGFQKNIRRKFDGTVERRTGPARMA